MIDDESQLTISLEKVEKEDAEKVGGKSANLGELANLGVPFLPGFTTTSYAYDFYIKGKRSEIRKLLEELKTDDTERLRETAEEIRNIIESKNMPEKLRNEIIDNYRELGERLGTEDPKVAVRSSATAEDLPDASFAGQQETFLNVEGEKEVINAVKKCYASLFTDRAISYREDKNFDHFNVKLSCAVQKMASVKEGASGVMFTMDPDTGFEKVTTIEAAYGLGELMVEGEVNPDTYTVFKPTNGIIEKKKGEKKKKMVYEDGENRILDVDKEKTEEYVLNQNQLQKLSKYAKRIEEHYGRPMDIEWVYDSDIDQIFILQARPETVHGESENIIRNFKLLENSEIVLKGVAVGDMIGTGEVKHLGSPSEMDKFEEGDVLVTERTDPDWEPIMKKASAIITEKGGKTSHAAIVARELEVPAIVGTETATEELEEKQKLTIDCTGSEGKVWKGELEYRVEEEKLDEIPDTETDIMLIMGDPEHAFSMADLPVDGVGLAREEFIISAHVGEHPLKLISEGEEEKFVDTLKTGIAKIAAAFHPNDVIVRLSDFKTDEYRGLEGGDRFEDEESNPMLGWRGASRYYHADFQNAFELECEAIKKCIEEGLDNLVVMVPFCRTPEEGERVINTIESYGLDREEIDFYVMAELPSNVMLADEFGKMFDGFSIGSNDLTQLTLGVDRNSGKLDYLFEEDHRAVKRSVKQLMEHAEETDTKVGICGDAPSTVEGYTEFLVEQGIDSISVSPDVALETIVKVARAEEAQDRKKEIDFTHVARNSHIDSIM